ncbi:hypothetical protein D3C86_2210040 [compost metagenome]
MAPLLVEAIFFTSMPHQQHNLFARRLGKLFDFAIKNSCNIRMIINRRRKMNPRTNIHQLHVGLKQRLGNDT